MQGHSDENDKAFVVRRCEFPPPVRLSYGEKAELAFAGLNMQA